VKKRVHFPMEMIHWDQDVIDVRRFIKRR
jgi:hypothetical protein